MYYCIVVLLFKNNYSKLKKKLGGALKNYIGCYKQMNYEQ